MPKQTLLFYDLETTGLNPCFDQVIQFAAIRTDLELKELSRHEFRIKLNPDIVPSPYAIITHRIGIDQMQQGEPEVDAICKIHKLINEPGTISLGYNTLGFDDEFLRFSFYRNLLPPYSHQYANGCGRMDIYPLTVLYYLFKPDVLEWPVLDHKVSLKLENIGSANNLMQGNAHDAMVDVEATLALARILHKERTIWDYSCGYFNKKIDLERSDKLPIAFETSDRLFRNGLMVNGKLGAANHFIAPVLSLGQHQHYKNQTLWLRLDQEKIDAEAQIIRKKMAEQNILLPPEPRFLTHLTPERIRLAEDNKQRLLAHPKQLIELCDYHQHYKYPDIPQVDIDAALYTLPFSKAAEDKSYQDFHCAIPQHKRDIAYNFPNQRRVEQALRILARHYPQYLNDEEKAAFNDYLEARCIDFRNESKLSIQAASEQALKLNETILDDTQHTLLNRFIEVYKINESTVL